MSPPSLEQLVPDAVAGERAALESLVRRIKDDIYGLALRMLGHPADAEDATQEILLRVVTRLSTFEGRSKFRTWVYRVAVRVLLNIRRGRTEPPALSFEAFGADLRDGLDEPPPAALSSAERRLLAAEIKIACTQAMLMCLDRGHRMAYLLGVVLELDGAQAAACLEITPAAYRKRLSRARQRVEAFTRESCGVANPAAPCSCSGRIAPALRSGRVDPAQLLFTPHRVRDPPARATEALVTALDALCRSDVLMRSNPNYLAPEHLVRRIRELGTSPIQVGP